MSRRRIDIKDLDPEQHADLTEDDLRKIAGGYANVRTSQSGTQATGAWSFHNAWPSKYTGPSPK